MDYTKDMEQVRRVQEKMSRMTYRDGNLVGLEEPILLEQVEELEAAGSVRLPEDYREIVSWSADGGRVPDTCNIQDWRSLRSIEDRAASLGVPYPPAQDPKALRGEAVPVDEPSQLPGQVLIMGSDRLGWSLITAGPCAGEVWTVGEFGVRRVPACTFSQWLELVLDGNLEACLTFCLTGEGGRFGRSRRLQDVIGAEFTWPEGADPAEQCARWLDGNRFVHQGPSDSWSGYLKSQIRGALALLPQERNEHLAALRKAQSQPGWQWNASRREHLEAAEANWERKAPEDWIFWNDPEEMARLGRLTRAIRTDGEEPVKAGLTPEDKHLFRQAAELARAKRFQQRGVRIRDLSFLKDLPQLKELDLWDNDIEDLSPLASLTGLKELYLPYNLIADLSPLAGLGGLAKLRLTGNRITSLEPLRGLTSLNVLDLRGNPLEPGALACLRKCKRLGMLDLSNTGLGDISGLEFCRAWNLDLYDNPDLTGLEVISTMKRLSCLYLDTEAARRYDIRALAPQLVEHVELGGLSLYVWPEKYFN